MKFSQVLRGYYALISLAAFASTCVPFLRRWARFGKLHHVAEREQAAHWLTSLLDVRVPKRCFLHFYVLGCSACAVALVLSAHANSACRALSHFFSVAAPVAGAPAETDTLLCLALLLIHTIRRLYECAFVERPAGEMHILAYALGLSYYALLPAAAIAECSALGLEAGSAAVLAAHARRLCATCAYAWASLHQHRCHRILAELRAHAPRAHTRDTPAEYRVPFGDWFVHVSCPHYLAEVLIYASLLIAKPKDRTLSALLAWVVVGHAINAHRAHAWYRATFAHYPRCRRALIPCVF